MLLYLDRRFRFLAAFFLCLALIFPGDISWINDEPLLFQSALSSNTAGTWAKMGLVGSTGVRNGPLPTWIYQVALKFTHNLILIVFVKTLLSSLTVFISFFLIGRAFGWSPYPLLLLFVSPFLYLYHRQLWDNCFLIPFSAVCFTATVHFLKNRSLSSLSVILLTSACLFLTHLMSVLVIVPVLATVVITEWKWLTEGKRVVISLALFLVSAILIVPYILDLMTLLPVASSSHPIDVGAAIASSLLGFRYFSALGFFEYFLPEVFGSGFFAVVIWSFSILSLVTAAVFWSGVKSAFGETSALHRRLFWICFGTILFSFFVHLLLKLPHHPHYFNATWVVYFYFLWFGFEKLKSKPVLLPITTGSLLVPLLVFAVWVHENGGNRQYHYGALLRNQIAVARTLPKSAWSQGIHTEINNYLVFPHALSVLTEIYHSSDRTEGKKYSVRYADPDNQSSGWITVESRKD